MFVTSGKIRDAAFRKNMQEPLLNIKAYIYSFEAAERSASEELKAAITTRIEEIKQDMPVRVTKSFDGHSSCCS